MFIRKFVGFTGILLCCLRSFAALLLGPNLVPDLRAIIREDLLDASYSVQQNAGPHGEDILLKHRTQRENYTLLSYDFPVLEPNKIFQFSVWLKTTAIDTEYTEVCSVEFYHRGKYQDSEILYVAKGDSNWHEVSKLITTQRVFDHARIVFFLQRNVSGEVCFASPSLREIIPDQESIRQECENLKPDLLPAAVRAGLTTKYEDYFNRMTDVDSFGLAEINEQIHKTEWNSLNQLYQNAIEFERIRNQVSISPDFKHVIIGTATAAEKILPHAPHFHISSEIKLSAAKNERESFQLVVFPSGEDLTQVSVSVSDLILRNEDAVIHDACDIMPVGYVKADIHVDYAGFYPDPLMTHLDAVEKIQAGDAQSFWIRFTIPKEQRAGIYQGEVTITVNGQDAFRFPLEVRVYDFTLPNRSMLPLAITYLLKEKHLECWLEMLIEYYITPDNLYNLQFRKEDSDYYGPDFELLSKMKKDGSLNRFNLGYIDEASENPASRHDMQFQIDKIRPRYEKAKELGLLDHAYIYGCDESRELGNANLAARIIKKEFPDVSIFTSAYDREYGTTGILPSWDWYCSLIQFYEETLPAIEKARQDGKQVWWYICCNPLKPYPNIFVDSPAIDTRLLMGFMSAKYRPDGFLYYEVTNWRRWNPEPLGNTVFTNWNPNSFGYTNGDGYWFYRGPDDIPLPSIRVENFRDGLEDYAYYEILNKKVKNIRQSTSSSPWLLQAEEALRIPKQLVHTLTDHTTDPCELYSYRNRLAELIEAID